MHTPVKIIYRNLLQTADPDTFDGKDSSSSTAALRRPLNPATTFDSSMALTILVLLTAFFFLGFFSVYIRRFVTAPSNNHPSPSTHRPYPSNQKRSGGLDPSAINSLPLIAYGKAAKHQMITDCPICLSEFQESESIKLIPHCGHAFHPKCVDTWLMAHVTCPLCRSAQLFKRVEEVRLDVAQERNDICGQGSTVENGDTWRDRELGGVRRICSCSNLINHSVLQRSTSF